MKKLLLWGVILESALCVVLIVVHAITLFEQIDAHAAVTNAVNQRMRATELADQLRQSSDDLTRMVRSYAATGEKKFKDAFFRILAIRNGKAPRPENYQRIYWDFILAEAPQEETSGIAIPLLELLKQVNITDEEMALLAQAEHASNNLSEREMAAIYAVEGLYPDIDGVYTVQNNPDKDFALRILFDDEYHQAKKNIMKPINQFLITLEKRTNSLVNTAFQRNDELSHQLLALFIAIIVTAAALVFTFFRYRREMEHEVAQKAKEVLTQEKIIEQQKRFAEMGKMIDAIAHQWRQPLNSIHLLMELIKDVHTYGGNGDTNLPELYEKHEELVFFMNKTIEDFRNYFRMDKQKQYFSVLDATVSTISLLKAQLVAHEIPVTISCTCSDGKTTCSEETLPYGCPQKTDTVYGLSGELKQVILNIVSNAKDALMDYRKKGGTGGKIAVVVTETVQEIHVCIFNTGNPISADVMSRLFTPYFTTKQDGKGTGLGLHLSRMIVENSFQGNITVSNTDDGVMFCIHLPRSTQEPK